MSKHLRIWLGGGLVAAALSLPACSNSPRPTAGELQEGLTLLDAKDANWGMNAAYKKDGHVIYIETRVGGPKPEIYLQGAPDDPRNEMDFRFVDAHNNTFYVSRGGDSYADPSWTNEIAVSRRAQIDPAQRALDFKLAVEAAGAFPRALPASFKDHAFHMAGFAAHVLPPSEDPHMIEKATRIAQAAAPKALQSGSETGYGWYSDGDWDWLETDKYSGSTGCFAWICTARHSATIQWVERYNNGSPYWVFAIDANNHGRHYYDSGMGYNCYSNGGWFYNATLSGSTAGNATGNWDGAGGCQTAYNWNSGGWDHLCNDDAAYELWQAKTGGWQTSQGDQIGFVWTANGHFACACSNNAGCDGDWSSPNCP